PAVAVLAVLAGLAAPLAWSLATIDTTHTGGTPNAGPAQAAGGPGFGRAHGSDQGGPFSGGGLPAAGQSPGGGLPGGGLPGGGPLPGGPGAPGGGDAQVPAALASLLRGVGGGYTWSAAAGSSMTAGPLELASGTAVMSLGGFNGSDPAITLQQFQVEVSAHRVRYYVTGAGFGGPGSGGGPGGNGTGQAIETWVSTTFTAQAVGGYTVYDLSAPAAHQGTGAASSGAA
ncbi:MAG TPA: hypothetical protein VFP72_16085, partial [Kineosporiaceae bacterium]|nr:hypothetical protein [Kineosporiaceae bacterium]